MKGVVVPAFGLQANPKQRGGVGGRFVMRDVSKHDVGWVDRLDLHSDAPFEGARAIADRHLVEIDERRRPDGQPTAIRLPAVEQKQGRGRNGGPAAVFGLPAAFLTARGLVQTEDLTAVECREIVEREKRELARISGPVNRMWMATEMAEPFWETDEHRPFGEILRVVLDVSRGAAA